MRDGHLRLAGGREPTRSNPAVRKFLDRLKESFLYGLQGKDEGKRICWKRQKAEFSVETACRVINGMNKNSSCANGLRNAERTEESVF